MRWFVVAEQCVVQLEIPMRHVALVAVVHSIDALLQHRALLQRSLLCTEVGRLGSEEDSHKRTVRPSSGTAA